MRGQYTFVDERLKTPTTVPDRPLPVFARAAPTQILELARRVPAVFVLYAAPAPARAEARLEQLRGGGLASDRKDVHVHRLVGPVPARARRRVVAVVAAVLVILAVDLLLDLLKLLVHVGRDLLRGRLLLLLDDDGLKSLRRVGVARRYDIAGDEAVVVEAEHRLHDVLHLVAGNHRADRQRHGNAHQLPKKRIEHEPELESNYANYSPLVRAVVGARHDACC